MCGRRALAVWSWARARSISATNVGARWKVITITRKRAQHSQLLKSFMTTNRGLMRELAPDAESTDGPRLGGSNSAGPRDGKDDGLTPVTEDGPYDGPRLGGSSSVGPQDERETGRRNTVSVAGDRSWQGFARIRPPGGDGGNGTGVFGTDVETELQSDSPDRSTLETHAIADPAIPTAKTRPAV